MKTIIAGSRTITDPQQLDAAIAASDFAASISEVVSGTAPGVDTLGEQWGDRHAIPVHRMPAEWLGRDAIKDPSAGRRRNVAMAKYADALIAVMHRSGSPGTRHMINAARSRGLKVYVHLVDD